MAIHLGGSSRNSLAATREVLDKSLAGLSSDAASALGSHGGSRQRRSEGRVEPARRSVHRPIAMQGPSPSPYGSRACFA